MAGLPKTRIHSTNPVISIPHRSPRRIIRTALPIASSRTDSDCHVSHPSSRNWLAIHCGVSNREASTVYSFLFAGNLSNFRPFEVRNVQVATKNRGSTYLLGGTYRGRVRNSLPALLQTRCPIKLAAFICLTPNKTG